MVALLAAPLAAQGPGGAASGARLPYTVGEHHYFRAKAPRMGASGTAEMWVEGPSQLRGRDVFVLRMRVRAGLGPFKGTDESTSWFDPVGGRTLRFEKHERHLTSRFDETIDVFPDERRWRAADGRSGAFTTDAPADELAFIYHLRTLPLPAEGELSSEQHYDAQRRPARVRLVGRERITVAAGTFDAIVVELRVRDPRRYQEGEGLLRFHLSDDVCRVPLRIESRMALFGPVILELDRRPAASPPIAPCDR